MINYIKDETIRSIIEETINEYGSKESEKFRYANEVAYWAYKLLVQRHLVTEGAQQSFVDLILGAALIHNIFINEDDENAAYQVFEARKNLTNFFKEKRMPDDFANYIFKIIECQYGEDSPVPETRPTPDTPQATVAMAKFIVDNFEDYDRWYMHTFYPELYEDNVENDAITEH